MTSIDISVECQGAARDVLADVLAFSSEEWSEAKVSFRQEWLLIARIFKAAIAAYCVASLQSASALPHSPELVKTKDGETSCLLELLQEAVTSPHVKKSLIWPLVVLGAINVEGRHASQTFVSKELSRLSHGLGTALPLTAKSVLEAFWKSEKTSWDECFDQPYCFLT